MTPNIDGLSAAQRYYRKNKEICRAKARAKYAVDVETSRAKGRASRTRRILENPEHYRALQKKNNAASKARRKNIPCKPKTKEQKAKYTATKCFKYANSEEYRAKQRERRLARTPEQTEKYNKARLAKYHADDTGKKKARIRARACSSEQKEKRKVINKMWRIANAVRLTAYFRSYSDSHAGRISSVKHTLKKQGITPSNEYLELRAAHLQLKRGLRK